MSSSTDNTSSGKAAKTSFREMTPEQTAEAIRNIARRIREESAKMRDTVKIIRQSGAIEELTEAVREATLAARDSAREINGVASELKQRGVIRDTINAGEEITATAKETAQTVRDSVKRNQTAESSPSKTTPA